MTRHPRAARRLLLQARLLHHRPSTNHSVRDRMRLRNHHCMSDGLCEFCALSAGAMMCGECKATYCHECDRARHTVAMYAGHKRTPKGKHLLGLSFGVQLLRLGTPLICGDCPARAAWFCALCETYYCQACFPKLHTRGVLRQHVPMPGTCVAQLCVFELWIFIFQQRSGKRRCELIGLPTSRGVSAARR